MKVNSQSTKDFIQHHKIYKFFQKIDKELRTQNRFSNAKLDKLIESLTTEESNIEILQPTEFKRARIYTKPDAFERFSNPTPPEFNGYNKKESFVNLTGCSEGRCNPKFINYLYVSDSVNCCIAETCPSIGSYVSIADIKSHQELRILNLSKNYAITNKYGHIIKGIPDCDIILYLQILFSRPHEHESDYLVTQYVAEKIKNAGFDGLSFHSSKYVYQTNNCKKQGINYVIFQFKKCEAILSELYFIDSIQYSYKHQIATKQQ